MRSKTHNRYRDPKTQEMTLALYRVRQPFLKRNVIGLVVCSVIPIAVYTYTWHTLSKDEFGDIPIPPIADDDLARLQAEYAKANRL